MISKKMALSKRTGGYALATAQEPAFIGSYQGAWRMDLESKPGNSMFDYPQEHACSRTGVLFAALGCAARLPTIS